MSDVFGLALCFAAGFMFGRTIAPLVAPMLSSMWLWLKDAMK